jgi:2-oxoglutarate ferredoxin oxidoreductase subunit delta
MADSYNTRGYRPAVLVDPQGKCTGCTLCAVICPDAVLTVYRLPAVAKATRAPVAMALAAAA